MELHALAVEVISTPPRADPSRFDLLARRRRIWRTEVLDNVPVGEGGHIASVVDGLNVEVLPLQRRRISHGG